MTKITAGAAADSAAHRPGRAACRSARKPPPPSSNALKTATVEKPATSAGCRGYISKPIDTRTFGDQIRAFLEAERLESGVAGD